MGISVICQKTILISLLFYNIMFSSLLQAQTKNSANLEKTKQIAEKIINSEPNTTTKVIPLKPGTFRIAQILPRKPPVVIIDGGKQQGIISNSLLDSFRSAPPPVPDGKRVEITTGRLKVIHVDENYAMATVIRDGGLIANAFFPEHPNTMSGDLVRITKQQLTRIKSLTPELSMEYSELFVDPKSFPTSFELSEEGRDLLRLKASKFKNLRVPALLIEAYTDKEGPAETNQVESYERALTIRQFLISEMGFSPSRVVAIGMGESSQIDNKHVSGFQKRNRRIILKVNMHLKASH